MCGLSTAASDRGATVGAVLCHRDSRLDLGEGDAAVTVESMSFTIEALRAASDDDLIRLHDQAATHTVVGTAYYMDELHRRDQVRAIESSHRLAVASFWLTVVNAMVAVVAVVIALASW